MNWHAMIVHFPIALFLTGFLLDAVGWVWKKESLKTTGLVLVVFGALGAGAAVLTGLNTEGRAEAQIEALAGGEAVLDAHKDIAIATAWVLALVALGRLGLRFASPRLAGAAIVGLLIFYFGLGSVGTGMLALTGYRGGRLVYEYGAGVQTTPVTAQGIPNDEH